MALPFICSQPEYSHILQFLCIYQWTILCSFSYSLTRFLYCYSIKSSCCRLTMCHQVGGFIPHLLISHFLTVFTGQESVHGVDGSFPRVSNDCQQSGNWGLHPGTALLSSSRLVQVVRRIQVLLVVELLAASVFLKTSQTKISQASKCFLQRTA